VVLWISGFWELAGYCRSRRKRKERTDGWLLFKNADDNHSHNRLQQKIAFSRQVIAQ
jgi:hypothetical protein